MDPAPDYLAIKIAIVWGLVLLNDWALFATRQYLAWLRRQKRKANTTTARTHDCDKHMTEWSLPYAYSYGHRQARYCTICKKIDTQEVHGYKEEARKTLWQ